MGKKTFYQNTVLSENKYYKYYFYKAQKFYDGTIATELVAERTH